MNKWKTKVRLFHRIPDCYKSPPVNLDVSSLWKLKFIYDEKIDQKKILLTKITVTPATYLPWSLAL